MALHDTFEPVKATLLHCIPLPTPNQAISELLSKETRLGTLQQRPLDTAYASHHSRSFKQAQSRNPLDQPPCNYCK
ncbi:hypothetical protein MRB53_005186 [Persea americana]|uniref:Uncharacterized protein n=1 Tax=Persea americana TaxID=3435 RepID=A0ACC2MDE0_PERAE|nr:hypothetical protein MRB53_005186 [Persea americana]